MTYDPRHSAPGRDAMGLTCVCLQCMDDRREARRHALLVAKHGFDKPKRLLNVETLQYEPPPPHRDLPRRMLAAVEDRVLLTQQQGGNARRRARAAEAAEILGILRNVVRAYESTETPI